MSASFEESVIALKSMFPDLSEVVVRATLEARDGHMESAVEKLLAMSRRGSGNGSSAHGGGAKRWTRIRRCAIRRAGGGRDVAERDGGEKRVRSGDLAISRFDGGKTRVRRARAWV